jgi:hypothetical protein
MSHFRLVFELVEAGMLFLQTNWFSRLCSCALRCEERNAGEFDYFLAAGTIVHEKPTWGTSVPADCWCSREQGEPSFGRHLRRLGILLTEIAIGAAIREVRTDPAGGAAGLVFMEGNPPARIEQTFNEVCNRIHHATNSATYKAAVKHCLESNLMPDEVTPVQINNYYWEVLIPWVNTCLEKLLMLIADTI